MRKCVSQVPPGEQPREQNGRVPAVALGALLFGLFMVAGEPPALAGRLDLSLQPFRDVAFDDAGLEPAAPAATDARQSGVCIRTRRQITASKEPSA